MAIITTLTPHDVAEMARNWGRTGNFGGFAGWVKLAEYMESLSDDTGEPVELDIVAWCCGYSHATSADDWARDHLEYSGIDEDAWSEADDDERLDLIRDELENNTAVVCCDDDCIIWQAY